LSADQSGPLSNTLASTHLIVTAYHGATLVVGTPHRVSIQGRAPVIVESVHHPSAPLVLEGQVHRNVVITHHQDFQRATAGFAGTA
jgi:hypothetical protein